MYNAKLRCVRAMKKAISIAYFDCVFVNLDIQYRICIRHIVICGLPGPTIFFYIIA